MGAASWRTWRVTVRGGRVTCDVLSTVVTPAFLADLLGLSAGFSTQCQLTKLPPATSELMTTRNCFSLPGWSLILYYRNAPRLVVAWTSLLDLGARTIHSMLSIQALRLPLLLWSSPLSVRAQQSRGGARIYWSGRARGEAYGG